MTVEFKASFLKQLQKLKDKALQDSIYKVIISVENAETIEDIPKIKKLTGYTTYYRVRVGDYRIGLNVVDNTVYFVTFDHRKDIYKYFP
ncbi:type II toxin-antitoxin system RelE family toxin [Runella sp.]|uniref:type II toxin-antitoxin system RelE family toxin n=1 Tax=Runella sp. TaxID=1960881 RepID=UPI003D13ED21